MRTLMLAGRNPFWVAFQLTLGFIAAVVAIPVALWVWTTHPQLIIGCVGAGLAGAIAATIGARRNRRQS